MKLAPGRSLHRGLGSPTRRPPSTRVPPHARLGTGRPQRYCAAPSTGTRVNPARAGTDPGPTAAAALAWARHHCLPLAALADPAVTRRALDALALRLDGTRGRGCDYHPQACCLPRLPRLRGRTRIAGSQPSGPHLMAAPEIVVPGRPAVSCYPCRDANGPGRGHQDLPGADRVLRLPVLRGTAPRRSRRTPHHVLHPADKRLGDS